MATDAAAGRDRREGSRAQPHQHRPSPRWRSAHTAALVGLSLGGHAAVMYIAEYHRRSRKGGQTAAGIPRFRPCRRSTAAIIVAGIGARPSDLGLRGGWPGRTGARAGARARDTARNAPGDAESALSEAGSRAGQNKHPTAHVSVRPAWSWVSVSAGMSVDGAPVCILTSASVPVNVNVQHRAEADIENRCMLCAPRTLYMPAATAHPLHIACFDC